MQPIGNARRWILFLAALATALPGLAQDASLARYEGPDRAQKLIAAAQKEGSFALYTSFAEKDLPTLTMEYAPTRVKVPSPLARQRFTLVDPAVALDQSDKWAKSFEEVILKRGGQ